MWHQLKISGLTISETQPCKYGKNSEVALGAEGGQCMVKFIGACIGLRQSIFEPLFNIGI
jgi:hypothetical protein